MEDNHLALPGSGREGFPKMLWTCIGVAAALLTMFGFVPQIIKMRKTKSAEDVSGFTLIQFGIGAVLWILYGTHLGDVIIIGANSISLVIVLTALVLYVKLGRNQR
jgi:MtN3 and saliva related transmembrane protein